VFTTLKISLEASYHIIFHFYRTDMEIFEEGAAGTETTVEELMPKPQVDSKTPK
jgi:hypothetical protein